MQAEAKLDYMGQAAPAEAFPKFLLPGAVWKQIREIADQGFQEELKDTWLNRQFRRDLYCRGGLRLPARQQINIKPIQAIELCMVKISMGWLNPVLPDNDPEPGKRLNRIFAEQNQYSKQYDYLAAPLVGSARRASLTDCVFLAGIKASLHPENNEEMSRYAWQSLASGNLKLKKEGATLSTPQDNLTHIQETIYPQWQTRTLPLWQALQIVCSPGPA